MIRTPLDSDIIQRPKIKHSDWLKYCLFWSKLFLISALIFLSQLCQFQPKCLALGKKIGLYMFSCICINISSESKVLESSYRAFMINAINIKRTYNFLCVLVLIKLNKFCKQSTLWIGRTMPEIYQQFLFEVSTSFPRNLGLKFKFSVILPEFGQYLK